MNKLNILDFKIAIKHLTINFKEAQAIDFGSGKGYLINNGYK